MSDLNKPSVIDSVMEKAKQRQQIDLTREELTELAQQRTVEEAKTKLQTKEELKHLVVELRDERRELGVDNKADNADQGLAMQLEDVERQIDAHASSIPDVVTIEPPEENTEPKTLVEKVKNFFGSFAGTGVGVLVSSWINIQRTLISLGVMQGSPQQLDAIEKLYGKFFGSSETLDKAGALLKDAGIGVVKDKKDANAYFELKKEYLTKLNARLQGKSPELQSMEREQYTFDAYLQEKTGAYAAAMRGARGTTTLTGIFRNQRPAETPAKASDK